MTQRNRCVSAMCVSPTIHDWSSLPSFSLLPAIYTMQLRAKRLHGGSYVLALFHCAVDIPFSHSLVMIEVIVNTAN